MKISTEIGSISRIVGEERAVELVAKAGFDAWDFSMFKMARYNWSEHIAEDGDHPLGSADYLKFARRLRQIGLDNGIHCNQSHAPFPTFSPSMHKYLFRAIECTAEAGGDVCVIHPANDFTPEQNAEMYDRLLPFAKDHGVRIATENMWNWDREKNHSSFAACATPDSFNAHLDAVTAGNLWACLDIGHSEMLGSDTSAPEMIRALGDRLAALHVHDNDKRNDSHQIPFSMNIDFDAVIRALKDIGYKGYCTLEADSYLNKFNADNVFDGVRDLAVAAGRFADMYKKM
ncbi:MAG: sugar phosphate isomerase/epimerase [Clostridia bacterium]|nr:sugar phosphate isomerase/epimerase [Clostridia bacterium]